MLDLVSVSHVVVTCQPWDIVLEHRFILRLASLKSEHACCNGRQEGRRVSQVLVLFASPPRDSRDLEMKMEIWILHG